MSKFLAALALLLVFCTSAHAQLTGTLDGSQNRAPVGFSVSLLAGSHTVETTGNFAFLAPTDVGDTHVETFYEDRVNGANLSPPIYMPGNVQVDFVGVSQMLTSFTGNVTYRPDHLYDFTFVAPAAGTYRIFSTSIPSKDFAGGAINFVEKGFVAAPVPEASTVVSLVILLLLGALAVLVRRKSIAN